MTPAQADALWAVAYYDRLKNLAGVYPHCADEMVYDEARRRANLVLELARKHGHADDCPTQTGQGPGGGATSTPTP